MMGLLEHRAASRTNLQPPGKVRWLASPGGPGVGPPCMSPQFPWVMRKTSWPWTPGDQGPQTEPWPWGPEAAFQSWHTFSSLSLLFCKMGLRPSRSVRGRPTRCLHQPHRRSVWSLPCTSHLPLPGSPGPQRSTDAPGTIREPGPWIAGPRRRTLRIDGRPSRMGAG